ncbi:MAG: flagellar motor switch protein FliG [Anaerolineaceae bacterium]|nr:flagellar motor switch protein FliG [Anaerolineaceae bacterium]
MVETACRNARKVAVLLVSIEEELAALIMSKLEKEQVEAIAREIAQLGNIGQKERDAVIEEFYHVALARGVMDSGGPIAARSLLEKTFSKEEAETMMHSVEKSMQTSPFSFLHKAESANLLTFIQGEHPQTIALILSHLAADKAAEILSGLPSKTQIEVVRRVANMEQTSPEVIGQVEKALESRLSAIVSQKFEKAGGVDSVAEMLNLADRSTEKGILETLDEDDPELVEQIRRLMFVFEDIILVSDKGIQSVLKEIENETLALALRTVSDELKEKIFKNMSERAVTLIEEDMEYMGPVRVADVEAAQQSIVDVVRRLEDGGEIIIAGRGGEEELVV